MKIRHNITFLIIKSLFIVMIVFLHIKNMNNAYCVDNFSAAIQIANAGINAQSERIKVISENISNANVTGSHPQEDPYRRKIIFFKNELDIKTGAEILKIERIGRDYSDFQQKYDPNHPAAKENGYVMMPNINISVEIADMKESQRSLDANVTAFEITRNNQNRAIDLLKPSR